MRIKKQNLGTLCFYCDESCHVKNDNSRYMAVATVYCRKDRVIEVKNKIKEIKEKYNIGPKTELKWGKVSTATLQMYKDIFTFIRDYKFLKIRVIVSNKDKVKKDYNTWYNTLYYHLIEYPVTNIIRSYGYGVTIDKVDIYSDKKDTHSYESMNMVCDFLQRHFKANYKNFPIFTSKVCDSYEVVLIQLADLLAGAATYKNRKVSTSPAKLELIKHMESLFAFNFSKISKREIGVFSNYDIFVHDPGVNKHDNF